MDNLYEKENWDSFVPMRPGGLLLTEKLINIAKMKDGLILDFGCGAGHTSEFLINKKFEVLGIDKSEVLLKKAMLRCPKADFLILDNLISLNSHEEFDGVISECVMSTLTNIREIINKIYDLLKYNGVFIINDITALIKKEENTLFTFSDWISVLKTSGFEILYYEDNFLELQQFYLKNLWENPSNNCVLDCIPEGYKSKEISYFSIIAKKI